jgi:hypothetical protein
MILQPDAGVGFAIVFVDVVQRSKTSWKTSVAHGASEYLGTKTFRSEATSLTIIMAPARQVPRAWLGLCTVILWVMLLV